jgi:hypothetical protein
MSLLNLAEIPGYAEAQIKEREARDLAFCDWPVPLCGLSVRQFTLTHLLILGNCDNAFVCSRVPEAEDVAFFLWVVSPDYVPDETARNSFVEGIASLIKYEAACREIIQYVDNAFQDAPGGSNVQQKSYNSFAAIYCDLFASEYGWDDALTMRKPIARLFQLYRRIQKRNNPKTVLFNPSDRVISRYLMAQPPPING